MEKKPTPSYFVASPYGVDGLTQQEQDHWTVQLIQELERAAIKLPKMSDSARWARLLIHQFGQCGVDTCWERIMTTPPLEHVTKLSMQQIWRGVTKNNTESKTDRQWRENFVEAWAQYFPWVLLNNKVSTYRKNFGSELETPKILGFLLHTTMPETVDKRMKHLHQLAVEEFKKASLEHSARGSSLSVCPSSQRMARLLVKDNGRRQSLASLNSEVSARSLDPFHPGATIKSSTLPTQLTRTHPLPSPTYTASPMMESDLDQARDDSNSCSTEDDRVHTAHEAKLARNNLKRRLPDNTSGCNWKRTCVEAVPSVCSISSPDNDPHYTNGELIGGLFGTCLQDPIQAWPMSPAMMIPGSVQGYQDMTMLQTPPADAIPGFDGLYYYGGTETLQCHQAQQSQNMQQFSQPFLDLAGSASLPLDMYSTDGSIIYF